MVNEYIVSLDIEREVGPTPAEVNPEVLRSAFYRRRMIHLDSLSLILCQWRVFVYELVILLDTQKEK